MDSDIKKSRKLIFKAMVYAIVVLFLFLTVAVIMWWDSIKTVNQINENIEKIYGGVSFKGRVIKIHNINRGGKTYGIMCIRIDSSNTSSFFRFDEFTCFKIKDGIATMPIGFLGDQSQSDLQILNSVYVEVNMNNSRKVLFIDNNRDTISKTLYYRNSNLVIEDLNICKE